MGAMTKNLQNDKNGVMQFVQNTILKSVKKSAILESQRGRPKQTAKPSEDLIREQIRGPDFQSFRFKYMKEKVENLKFDDRSRPDVINALAGKSGLIL